jgi:phosphinothricin acetyltransferase
MKTAILNKNDLNIDIKEQVSELFRQLSPNKIQLDLEEILNEKNQITVAYCEDNNKIIGMDENDIKDILKIIESGKKIWDYGKDFFGISAREFASERLHRILQEYRKNRKE